jgi:hypothetical protein
MLAPVVCTNAYLGSQKMLVDVLQYTQIVTVEVYPVFVEALPENVTVQ